MLNQSMAESLIIAEAVELLKKKFLLWSRLPCFIIIKITINPNILNKIVGLSYCVIVGILGCSTLGLSDCDTDGQKVKKHGKSQVPNRGVFLNEI